MVSNKRKKLLLLHGALGSKDQFAKIIALLREELEVYVLNFDGHGGSDYGDDFSIRYFTRQLAEYIERESLSDLNIFGYSMGGYVALKLAQGSEMPINRIITLATKFNWSMESALKEVKMLDPAKIEEKVPSFAKKLQKQHYPNDWKELVQRTAHLMIDIAQNTKLEDEDFLNISIPVTIGIGSKDRMVSLDESRHISGLLPDSKLKILEGVEHPIESIDAEILVEYILEALA